MKKISKLSIAGISIVLVVLLFVYITNVNLIDRRISIGTPECNSSRDFSGESAYEEVLIQVSFGPRNPGSKGHSDLQDYLKLRLREYGFTVEVQPFVHMLSNGSSLTLQNIVAKKGNESNGLLLIGAHYDTRPISDKDKDPENRNLPISGANDGASGVAVLLELAKLYSKVDPNIGLWLLFFDAEDIGGVYGPYSLGASTYVSTLEDELLPLIKGVIIVDMVGDSNLEIFYERNSLSGLSRPFTEQIWEIGSNLGYSSSFKPEVRHNVIDDHIPFLQKGLPTTLIIDFDYEYWHTQQDTIDRVSPSSLQIVGRVLVKSIEVICSSR